MTRRLIPFLALPLILAACGDSPEKIGNDMAAEMRNVAKIVNGVTDEASAKAAVEQIKEAKTRMDAIGQRMAKVATDPKASADVIKAAGEEVKKASAELDQARESLQKKSPAAYKIIDDAMGSM